ncbi:MAG TPA: glycosyltransferase family 2 protein [Pyrinomonadaceae bacterium]|nr:glycosyltransferase family 2 protein [Pyrinomonadaceae bacterium]
MQLSVIVVSYNTRGLLTSCLGSVERYMAGVEHEVCVVDNASSDGGAALVREMFPRARVLSSPRNLGFAAAVNMGLGATSGRYVLWLNPDAEILNGGISALLSYMEAEPGVGIVGPQLLNTDGSIQLSCRSFPSYDAALFNRHSLLTSWFPQNRYTRRYLHTDWDHMSARAVDWVSGACLLHRREVSDQIGGLDERFFIYMEDIDFCLRAGGAGWEVIYHPAMLARHHIGGSSRQAPYRTVVELHRSVWRYYAKHFTRSPLKDVLAGAAIWGRCAAMLCQAAVGRGDARLRRGPALRHGRHAQGESRSL